MEGRVFQRLTEKASVNADASVNRAQSRKSYGLVSRKNPFAVAGKAVEGTSTRLLIPTN